MGQQLAVEQCPWDSCYSSARTNTVSKRHLCFQILLGGSRPPTPALTCTTSSQVDFHNLDLVLPRVRGSRHIDSCLGNTSYVDSTCPSRLTTRLASGGADTTTDSLNAASGHRPGQLPSRPVDYAGVDNLPANPSLL